ncbi:response regulator transcription factor [Mammaliicoccus stepanovicii]|uniref:Two-component response regulator n=1 Tax=Mammaliicoccus stepanovicii TaxID=643214 RepID=A0A239Y7Q0_9STAP|nr:response regulator [Mammaliicoccus stepanovicii]PNZ78980.1 DNA-binding response regulator [Mammaliicoccus stepanovicii]GGI43379.1 putative response regulatory protein [Mammaliicoccus stepanovicii]SNV54413.1 Two-component response regulator [Mammaliicoccus stepanovicii]
MYKAVICDDERIIREGIKHVIPWERYHFDEVYLAKDGIEGLSLIRKHKPELVITDIRMPRLDGIGLLNEIKDMSCQKVILSSYDDFEYMKAGIKHQVLDYFLKPIDESQLIALLEQLSIKLATQPSTTELEVFEPLMQVEFDDFYVNYVIKMIKQRYHEKISVSEIIGSLEVSESYIMRTFKSRVGITILDYLNRYRIYQSLELLNSHYKNYEIAEKVGFSEYKAYSYHFKKYLNMSSKTYLQKNI